MDSDGGALKGVFTTSERGWVGFGATKKKVERDVLYYCEEQEDGSIRIQTLNDSYIPAGDIRYITREELLKNYLPDPDSFINKMIPAMAELEDTLAGADKSRQRGELFSAEHGYKCALRMDEMNIRATFGLGLTYLDRNENSKAELVFRRLVKLRDSFMPKHKHLFNEFGISLRKSGLLNEAIKYYGRARELSKDDEHLMYNMARTLFEKGDMDRAYEHLRKAVDMNPDFEPAQGFIVYMERKGLVKAPQLAASGETKTTARRGAAKDAAKKSGRKAGRVAGRISSGKGAKKKPAAKGGADGAPPPDRPRKTDTADTVAPRTPEQPESSGPETLDDFDLEY